MPTHSETKILPYTERQIFDLVADVEKYPLFLPWVTKATVVQRGDSSFIADLEIGYKFLTTVYRSEVVLHPHSRIDVKYLNGPFSHLQNHWQFKMLNEKLTEVDFYIDFEFSSSYLQTMIQPVFSEAVRRLIGAFEKRAAELY